ncbi:MAG: adenylate/guanylate cyclase domain-containing protein [Leptospiraceae bacterium]|nr:adenylate/guanylate cyclase domain-containing protein [Leptospiraceae bacterium]MCP5498297.1 adenylate/guanylate cyclase domain-containing protein [Leptospiraceae bacterium]
MTIKRRIYTSASEDRLEQLIQLRLENGADKAKIDERIWNLFGEEWSVMFTDLSGFSRRASQFGIIHFLQTIYESERILTPIIEEQDGILLKAEGDSFLVIFRSPLDALEASLKMQKSLHEYNQTKIEEEKVLLCIGLGHGKILRIGDKDVFGSQVNFASKLGEDTAKAYEILVTGSYKSKVENFQGVSFESIDETFYGDEKAFKVNYSLS